MQSKIQQQEYEVSFQEKGVSEECADSYQAPNRAQDFRKEQEAEDHRLDQLLMFE